MSEPWIRVHANLSDKPVVFRAVEALGVTPAEAVGLLVSLWGAVSQHAANGHVATLPDSQIESWAGWTRKRGRFAEFVRTQHVDGDGRINEWDDYAGYLEDRKERDRTRKRKSRGQSRGRHADSPQDVRTNSAPTKRNDNDNDTKRNERVVVDDYADAILSIPPEPELTALFLTVCANTASTERWGESLSPFTQGSASTLASDLHAAGIPADIARLSIYEQIRNPRMVERPGHINYFRKGIVAAWEAEQARRAMRTSGERPPIPPTNAARTGSFSRRDTKRPTPQLVEYPAASDPEKPIKWT